MGGNPLYRQEWPLNCGCGEPEISTIRIVGSDYFIIDLWYWCLGMRSQVIWETEVDREKYVAQDIERHKDNLVVNYCAAGRAGSTSGATQTTQRGRRCYLSTAACQAMGLPDDCDELQLLREYRDTVLSLDPVGSGDIARYYATAPELLRRIQARSDATEILRRLYRRAVQPAAASIASGHFVAAHAVLRRLLDDFDGFILQGVTAWSEMTF